MRVGGSAVAVARARLPYSFFDAVRSHERTASLPFRYREGARPRPRSCVTIAKTTWRT